MDAGSGAALSFAVAMVSSTGETLTELRGFSRTAIPPGVSMSATTVLAATTLDAFGHPICFLERRLKIGATVQGREGRRAVKEIAGRSSPATRSCKSGLRRPQGPQSSSWRSRTVSAGTRFQILWGDVHGRGSSRTSRFLFPLDQRLA